jgi:glycosyltransferase involved in cell wall biosynthesis
MAKPILFVSAVREWGGSEVLWADTASLMADRGHAIKIATRYRDKIIQKLGAKGAAYIDISEPVSLVQKAFTKLRLKKHSFVQAVKTEPPALVVISQGSNVAAGFYMGVCRKYKVPYVTVTQLVTNILWAFNDDNTLNQLREGYAASECNFFISQDNVDLHNLMIGDEHPNSKLILNPLTVRSVPADEFPPLINGNYQVALVGRLEAFHKGHDLLLQVVSQPKWKERNIQFNLYGKGPHLELLNRLVKRLDARNVFFKGFAEDITKVWKENHLLILPSRMEGQALALNEAMWCNRPSVVTDVGSAKELIADGQTGFIADNPTIQDVDRALERAWLQRNDWEQLGKNAGRKIREVYQHDPLDAFAKELENILKKNSA